MWNLSINMKTLELKDRLDKRKHYWIRRLEGITGCQLQETVMNEQGKLEGYKRK